MEKIIREKYSPSFRLILIVLAIVINIVGGEVVSLFHIPLVFLDTIGTIFIAVAIGPLAGALTGGVSNVLLGFLSSPTNIPFALVSIVIGLVVGIIAKYFKFNYIVAFFTGLLLAVIAPLIGTPIAIVVFGGVTGSANDIFFAILRGSGHDIFTSAFLPRIGENLIDKIGSCLLVSFLLSRMPKFKYLRGSKKIA